MDDDAQREPPAVFFWIIVVLAALYLGLRLVQGVQWLVRWIAG